MVRNKMGNKKPKYIDDGHTIYDMNVDGMPNYKAKSKDGLNVTRKEKKAMIKAALAHYLPIVIGIIVCFLIAMLLIYLWLS